MIRTQSITKRLALGALTLVSLTAAPIGALADQSPESFKGTNFINTGVQYTTNPTNGTGLATGTTIDVGNYERVGFYLTGDAGSITNASVIDFTFLRAHKRHAGITNMETTGQSIYKIRVPIGPITNSTFTFYTNMPIDFIGSSAEAGVNSMTNNLTTGCSITNAEFGLTKKIVPTRFP